MKSKLIADDQVKTFVIIFDPGDEVASGLKKFAQENRLSAASFKAVGAFEKAMLGWFNLETQEYEKIPFNEQIEVLSLIGDVAINEKQEPQVHTHCVIGKRDGTAHGGHLLEAFVRPTLEVVLTENPAYLQKTFRQEFGIALIDLDK